MAVPKRTNKYSGYKQRKQMSDSLKNRKCLKQFPECPEEVNDNDCKECPFFKNNA